MAEDERGGGSPWRAVVGLGLIAVLIVGVLFVMQQLRHAAAIQDCVASGRRDCAPVAGGR
nr:hypothetical protein [uncultured Rhodopila sp.]